MLIIFSNTYIGSGSNNIYLEEANLIIYREYKRIFDKIQTNKNFDLSEMFHMIKNDVHEATGMNIIGYDAVKNYHNRSTKPRKNTILGIKKWIEIKNQVDSNNSNISNNSKNSNNGNNSNISNNR